jgi:hypothetical protein
LPQPGEDQLAKSTRNTGKPWTPADVKQLKELAKGNTPTRVAGLKLGRTEAAVYKKASEEGISLAVCTENSNPDVMMVKPGEDRV